MEKKNSASLVLGIFAHVDAGKTTLTERMLVAAGALAAPGSVDKGTTQTDHLGVERRRGISVRSVPVCFLWNNYEVCLVDTPGHRDFSAEVERVLPVLDGALILLSGVEGVQAYTETLWKALDSYEIPRMLFINKLDRDGASFTRVLEEARKKLHRGILPLQSFKNGGFEPYSPWDFPEETAYSIILENLAELDEEVLHAFVEGEKVPSQRLQDLLRQYTQSGDLFPVFGGAALHGAGIKEILQGITTYLPASSETPGAPLKARVFGIMHHDSLGRGTLVRLFSGNLSVRQDVPNVTRGVAEKIFLIRRLGVGKLENASSLKAGELGILFGMGQTRQGDLLGETLHFPDHKKNPLGEPFYAITVEPFPGDTKPALLEALKILADEDPRLHLRVSDNSKEIQIHIFGPMQIEILQDFLKERFALEPCFHPPRIMYRETIAITAQGYVEYTMPKPCWAVMRFQVEPLRRGEGVQYRSMVSTDKIARKYQNEVERAIPQALEQGLLGWEVVDVGIILLDGEDHNIHSRPSDFVLATPMGIMDALNRGGSTLLEPLFAFEIALPEEYGSKVLGDLLRMGGEYENPLIKKGVFHVTGLIPVEAVADYHIRLGALSRGTARISLHFGGYREYPLQDNPVVRPRTGVNPLDKAEYILAARGALR